MATQTISRRVRKPAQFGGGFVVVTYDKVKRTGRFESALGPVTVAGNLKYVCGFAATHGQAKESA
jgi:hypothetical protein